MSSTDELLREIENDGPSTQSETETESRRSRIANSASQIFSPRRFLVSLVLISVGLLITGTLIPILSSIPGTGFAGVFIAAFVLGALNSEQWYSEVGVAGAAVSGVSLMSGYVTLAIVSGLGLRLVLVGGAIGVVIALLGHYFGRDLRGGMMKEIE